VGRFDDAVAWARGQAELIEEDVPFEAWRARAAYYFDSVGNLVELIARERAPGAELLIEVSEVGLPVADVGAAVDFLEAELGLPHFSGDRSNFSAVGDDHGLFILVPVGRPWLFTDRPASDAPVRVTIEGTVAGELRVPGSEHAIEVASS
jgi:catechol-2,3-dioxygenase